MRARMCVIYIFARIISRRSMKLSNFSLKIYMSSKNSERKNANSYPATTIKLELNSELVYNCISSERNFYRKY